MLDWINRFSGLSDLEPQVHSALLSDAKQQVVPKGTVIFGPDTPAENLLLVLDGTVRVQQLSEDGREIVLYRVHPGESCVLTTACLLAHEDYSAEAIAETDVSAVAIPRKVFDQLISQSSAFRSFVFQAYSNRIMDLFLTIEEIAFQRMDIRLAHKLLELDPGTHQIAMTHAQLASELGTAREVVSRQLAEFQRRDWVTLSRGQVSIKAPDALRQLAEYE